MVVDVFLGVDGSLGRLMVVIIFLVEWVEKLWVESEEFEEGSKDFNSYCFRGRGSLLRERCGSS